LATPQSSNLITAGDSSPQYC